MKTLIVPDIHEKIDKTKRILKEFSHCEKTVFLGDYFDSFDQPFSKFKDTLFFLKDNFNNFNIHFLLGNHDIHYFYPLAKKLVCSGYEGEKAKFIKHNLSESEIYDNFDLFTNLPFSTKEKNDIIVSHAGISSSLVHPTIATKDMFLDWLYSEDAYVLEQLKYGFIHPFVDVGMYRGGHNKCGGLTWCDWNYEFHPVPYVKQIVGHTNILRPEEKNGNWNIDCELNYVCVVEDGKIETFDVHKI